MGLLDPFLSDDPGVPLLDPSSTIPTQKGERPGDVFFDMHKESTEVLAGQYSYRRELDRLNGPQKAKEEKHEVRRDAPFLGFTDIRFIPESVFAPKLDAISLEIITVQGGMRACDAKVMIAIGSKGSGKSWLSSVMVDDNWIDRYWQLYGIKVLCVEVDPNNQDEWYVHRDPITKTFPALAGRIINFFKSYSTPKFDMKPRGYTSVVYGLDMDKDNPNIDKFFTPTWRDFLDIYSYDPTLAKSMCADILGIPATNVTDRKALGLLMVNATKYGIANFERLEWFLSDDKAVERELRGTKPTNLHDYVISARDEHNVSDGSGSSLPSLIPDVIKYDKVILRTVVQQTATSNSYQNVRLISNMVFIEKIRHQMVLGFSLNPQVRAKSAFSKDIYPAGLVLKVDEAEAIFPADTASYISKYAETLGTKDRKSGISLFCITQYPNALNPKIVGMSDIKFVAAVDTEETANALKASGVDPLVIKEARKLRRELNPFGMKVAEWMLFEKRVKRGKFWPIFPRSACYLA